MRNEPFKTLNQCLFILGAAPKWAVTMNPLLERSEKWNSATHNSSRGVTEISSLKITSESGHLFGSCSSSLSRQKTFIFLSFYLVEKSELLLCLSLTPCSSQRSVDRPVIKDSDWDSVSRSLRITAHELLRCLTLPQCKRSRSWATPKMNKHCIKHRFSLLLCNFH